MTLARPVVNEADWRLQGQERYLRGAVLQRTPYSPYRDGWDHDHCEFCGSKFTAEDRVEGLREGYSTPDRYRWICPTCFEDFRERFGWSVIESGL